jgi:hypothetical protein
VDQEKLKALRTVINESLRVQLGGASNIEYVDPGSFLIDIQSRQNHVVFARRGCGKTLLLHQSAKALDSNYRAVYINCEDYKHHSFPNVLIEILDALFAEMERHLSKWFGRGKETRRLIEQIRTELSKVKKQADATEHQIKETNTKTAKTGLSTKLGASGLPVEGSLAAEIGAQSSAIIESTYKRQDEKIAELNVILPRLKSLIREFFASSKGVSALFLQLDDLYHLKRTDQPFVVDYVHRLCKDVPIYFKLATLRHASTLYADRGGQPIGAQERHDFQPLNVDFSFADFRRTCALNKQILYAFANRVGLTTSEVDGLFKGEGFERLVMAGGGVPRDFLSLFLEVLQNVQKTADGRIGKDDVRLLSRATFEHRIEELKQDCEGPEQETLVRGIYVIRKFCLERQSNVFLVSEQTIQSNEAMRTLIYRLMDYRIAHHAGAALTHKSYPGTYQAFAVDMGCYAHLRKHQGKLVEIDFSDTGAKEQMRSAPVLEETAFELLWAKAPKQAETELLAEEEPAA